jgi:hypothetical protein
MGGAHMGGNRNMYIMLAEKPEGKRPLGKARCGWENNIRVDVREIEWENVVWIYLAQSRDQWQAVVNTVMKLRVP